MCWLIHDHHERKLEPSRHNCWTYWYLQPKNYQLFPKVMRTKRWNVWTPHAFHRQFKYGGETESHNIEWLINTNHSCFLGNQLKELYWFNLLEVIHLRMKLRHICKIRMIGLEHQPTVIKNLKSVSGNYSWVATTWLEIYVVKQKIYYNSQYYTKF